MFTLIWGLVGGVAPKFVPRGPHQSLIQVELSLIVGGVAPKFVPHTSHLYRWNYLLLEEGVGA